MSGMFIPLRKVDEARRMIFGWIDETPDHAREVMDYATAKAAFQKWSGDQKAASGGKSFGNIRAMHQKIAAGIIPEPIVFNDAERRVEFWAKVTDENEWQKALGGTYTGFSPGGGYAKTWPDPTHRGHRRYTPIVSEISLVDKSCIPTAAFQLIKADGTVEEREFLEPAFEPGRDAIRGLAEEMAKAAGKPTRTGDYVVSARADLIKAHAEGEAASAALDDEGIAALIKAANPVASEGTILAGVAHVLEKWASDPTVDDLAALAKGWTITETTADPAAELEAALSAAGEALNKGVPAVVVVDDRAEVPVLAPAILAAFDSAGIRAIAAALDGGTLSKGVWNLEWMARLLEEVNCLRACLTNEAAMEGDASPAPAAAEEIVRRLAALLVQQAQEETAELLADMAPEYAAAPALMELAAPALDLVKADGDLLEKIGKRNSTNDQARIQGIHDHAVTLGAGCEEGNCEGVAEKLAKAAASSEALSELARSRRVMAATVPQLQELTKAVAELRTARETDAKTIGDLTEKLEKIGKGPAPGKGVLFAVSREEDGRGLEKVDAPDGKGPPPSDPSARRAWAIARLNARGGNGSIPAPGGGGRY